MRAWLLLLAACGAPLAMQVPEDAGARDAGPDAGACGDLQLSTSGTFDLDLKAVAVSGVVSLDGLAAPAGSSRGAVTFSSDGGQVSAEVADAGTASYSTRLFAGTYDVGFSKPADCGAGKLPCGTQALKARLPVFTSGALDLDVRSAQSITVSGAVTVSGAAPAAGARGRIEFRAGDAVAGADLPGTGSASFSVQLSPGAWDVHLLPPAGCTQASPLPCQEKIWARGLSLLVSGSLAVDLTVVQLTGAVKVNGLAMASAAHPRGSLRALDGDGFGPAADLGSSGAASYSLRLYAGAHDLWLEPPASCTPSPLPCARHLAARAVPASSSGAYDLDLPVVQVSGAVTANGLQAGPALRAASRGSLRFALAPDDPVLVPLGASGAATYSALLYAGTYEVALANPLDCPDSAFPCGTRALRSSVPLTAGGSLDLDVAQARVTVLATVNGQAFPAAAQPRGTVTLHGPTDVQVALPASGSASAAATVYRGNHELIFANAAGCPNGPAPCQSFTDSARSIQADGQVALDLPVLDVSGRITLNGAALPKSQRQRGELRLVLDAQAPVVFPLEAAGDQRYAVRLFPGSYRLDFHNSTDCPDGALPCQGPTPLRSLPILTSGALDVDLRVFSLSGLVTLDGASLPESAGASRGALRLGPLLLDLGASGPAHYSTRLLEGAWPVSAQGAPGCDKGGLPCGSVVVPVCH